MNLRKGQKITDAEPDYSTPTSDAIQEAAERQYEESEKRAERRANPGFFKYYFGCLFGKDDTDDEDESYVEPTPPRYVVDSSL